MAGSEHFRTLMYTIKHLLQQGKHKMVLGFRNAAVLRDQFKAIAQATYIHSRNLAYYVFTYKGLQALQERIQRKSL